MKKQIVQALILKYEGVIAEAKMNIDIYLEKPAGIGEHPEILESIDLQVNKIAEAEDKISTLQKHFVDQKVI
tara:strand:+ start:324 stop:539 length:216 start_codon:yes stop_codon:yes gene_type:complete